MTQDEMVLLSKGRVPADAVLPPVLARLSVLDRDRAPDEPSELTLLCERQGLDYGTVARLIYRYENPETDGGMRSLDFNTADKLLCGATLYDMWFGVLAKYYTAVDLSWRKCECPGCETMFKPTHAKLGATGQRYCSAACRNAAKKIRRGESTQRRKNWKGTKTKCRNNHERTVANTKFRGNGKMECLLCHRASAKRAYEKKMAARKGALVAA